MVMVVIVIYFTARKKRHTISRHVVSTDRVSTFGCGLTILTLAIRFSSVGFRQ